MRCRWSARCGGRGRLRCRSGGRRFRRWSGDRPRRRSRGRRPRCRSNERLWCRSNERLWCRSNDGPWCRSNERLWCRSNERLWCRSNDGLRRRGGHRLRCHHLGYLLGRRLLRAHLRLHDPLLRCRLAGSGLGAALHLAHSLRRYPLAGRLARRGAPGPPRGRAARHLAGGRLPRARPLLRCLFPTGGSSHLEHSLVCAIYRFL